MGAIKFTKDLDHFVEEDLRDYGQPSGLRNQGNAVHQSRLIAG